MPEAYRRPARAGNLTQLCGVRDVCKCCADAGGKMDVQAVLLAACGPKDIGTGTSEPDTVPAGVSGADSMHHSANCMRYSSSVHTEPMPTLPLPYMPTVSMSMSLKQ